MAPQIQLETENYGQYISDLRTELNIEIETKPQKEIEGTVPVWKRYVAICDELLDTLTLFEEMLIANSKDFEKAAKYINIAGGNG